MKKIILTLLMVFVPLIVHATTYEVTTPGNNIGIGSTNPGQALDVQGTVRASVAFIAGTGSATITGSSGGNIGINQSSPAQQLDVNGTVKMTGFQLGTSTTNGYVLTASGTGGTGIWAASTGGSGLWTTANTNDVYLVNSGTYGNVGIGTSLTNLAQLRVLKNSTTDYMHIDSTATGAGNVLMVNNAGNIGIGSTTPGQILDVNGTVRATSLIATGSGLTNFAGGNVGINSANPGQILDVVGTIRISNLGGTMAVASGSNGCQGQGTLSSGLVTISTTCTPANSQGIFLTDAETSLTNLGSVSIATVSSGSSFIIQSTNASDSSKVNWWIIKSS